MFWFIFWLIIVFIKKKSQNNSDLIKCEKNDDKILRCALRLKNECKNYLKFFNKVKFKVKEFKPREKYHW